MSDRSTREIARDALKDAQARGIVARFEVREGGRATVYPTRGNGKYYTQNALDTLVLIKQLEKEIK